MSGETKRLYRSKDDRVIAGICGGLAKYLAIDPTIVRVIFIVAALAGGPGVLAYIILFFVMPEEPEGGYTPPPPPTAPEE